MTMFEYLCSVPSDITYWLGQLKGSLSQLLVLAIDDDLLGADLPLATSSSGSQSTSGCFAVTLSGRHLP